MSHSFIPNLVTQIDRSFQQSGTSIYQNNPIELLFIALIFHIEMYFLGLEVFLKVLTQVVFTVNNRLFLSELSTGFPNYFFKITQELQLLNFSSQLVHI